MQPVSWVPASIWVREKTGGLYLLPCPCGRGATQTCQVLNLSCAGEAGRLQSRQTRFLRVVPAGTQGNAFDLV